MEIQVNYSCDVIDVIEYVIFCLMRWTFYDDDERTFFSSEKYESFMECDVSDGVDLF